VTSRGAAAARPGLTLLEVLVALAIFLLSLAAITRLVTFAGQRALDARRTEEAARLARSKFAEVFAGAVPLQGQGDTPFDEDPDYTWSVTADSGSLTGLWVVTVTVKRKGDDGPGFSLQQLLVDPTVRGSTQDTVTIAGTPSSSSGSGGSSPGSSSSAQKSSTPTPAAAASPADSRGGKSSTPAATSPGRGSSSTGGRTSGGPSSGGSGPPAGGRSSGGASPGGGMGSSPGMSSPGSSSKGGR
jgi:prepilin-type N-terminal cleavage/methylation domain-containing protein